MIEFLSTERMSTEECNKPSYYAVCASYIRAFPLNQHATLSDAMPIDKRITLAVRELYRKGTTKERLVMTRAEDCELTARERSIIFNVLVYRLARMAGFTAYTVIPTCETNKTR